MPGKDNDEGPAVGDIVLFNPADTRGWVEATVTRVRAAEGDDPAMIDITYPHHRTDVDALATGEKVRHGFGAYQYCLLDERPREPVPPSIPSITPSGEAAAPAQDPTENVAGLEQSLRVALGLAPDASAELVKARLEVARENAAAISEIVGTNDPDDDDDGSGAEFLCVIEGCEKAEPGNGYKSLASLRRHAADKHDGATVLVGDGGVITFGQTVEGTTTDAKPDTTPTGVPTSANPETSHSSGSGGGQPPAAKQ